MSGSGESDALRRKKRPEPRYDVVVIGAGINGAGVFRDLSLQGVNLRFNYDGKFGETSRQHGVDAKVSVDY